MCPSLADTFDLTSVCVCVRVCVQNQREVSLAGFRSGKFPVLVATDVAARGLDISGVELVVQCEPPKDPETYIHRSACSNLAFWYKLSGFKLQVTGSKLKSNTFGFLGFCVGQSREEVICISNHISDPGLSAQNPTAQSSVLVSVHGGVEN